MGKKPHNFAQDTTANIGSAIQASPTLRSAWQACYSDGFMTRLQKYADSEKSIFSYFTGDNKPQRYAHALERLFNEDPSSKFNLTNSDIGKIAQLITGPKYVNRKLLQTLYFGYRPEDDNSFMAQEIPKRMELFRRIQQDPEITNLRKNWKHADFDDRIRVAQRIGEIQSSIYGFQPQTIRLADLSSKGAEAIHQGDVITFDMNYLKKYTFAALVNVTVHENEHEFQDEMISRMKLIQNEEFRWADQHGGYYGSLSKKQAQQMTKHMGEWVESHLPGGIKDSVNRNLLLHGNLRETALALAYSEAYYFDTNRDRGYINTANPREKHSWGLGSEAEKYFTDENGKQKVTQRNESLLKIYISQVNYARAELEHTPFDKKCASIPLPSWIQ